MMSDAKAMKAAEYLKRYCGERGCDPEVCAFRTESGICVLQAARLPENFQLDGIETGEELTCELLPDTVS